MSDALEPERRWLGRTAAAQYLGIGTSTLDRLVNDGRLTRYKVGHLARFDAKEIDALVISGATPPVGASRAG